MSAADIRVAARFRGAAAIVFDGAGRVLLVRWARPPRSYGPPGGRLEPSEEPHDAAVREVREETGLVARVERLVGIYSFDDEHSAPYLVMYAFLCQVDEGTPVVAAPREICEVGWFDPLDLPQPLENVAPHAIPDAVRREYGVVRTHLRWRPV